MSRRTSWEVRILPLMEQRNPYAPSLASMERGIGPLSQSEGVGVWRDGKVLVTSLDAVMPERCVKCNEPADEPTKARKVFWHHPLIYLLVLLNVVLYAVVALIVRKKVIVAAGLCADHKARRKRSVMLTWAGVLGGIVVMYVGASSSMGVLGVGLGILLILASLLVGLIFARIVHAQKIDNSYVRLRGCGTPFLDSLPPFRG